LLSSELSACGAASASAAPAAAASMAPGVAAMRGEAGVEGEEGRAASEVAPSGCERRTRRSWVAVAITSA
jgi:hypothetical protein